MDHQEGWSELPYDLLEKIVDRLILSTDYIRLRRVCSSWRSALPNIPKPQFPWLLLPYNHNITHTCSNDHSSMRSFLNLSNNRVYEVELPGIHEDMLYRGSSMGWLITVERQGPAIRLINPITAAEFQLPPLSTFPYVLEYRPDMVDEEYVFRECGGTIRTDSLEQFRAFFLQKVVLSSSFSTAAEADACSSLYHHHHHHANNNSNYYIAIAICSDNSKLAVCKHGDDRWTTVKTHKHNSYDDIIFYRERFYAVNQWGRLSVILMEDDDHPHPREKVVVPSPGNGTFYCGLYLAEDSSTRDLLMIVRHTRSFHPYNPEEDSDEEDSDEHYFYRTVWFDVYKLDRSKRKKGRPIGKWCKVDSLGHDSMLFLGRNSSVCLSSKDFPGFRGNCIYFTDDNLVSHEEGIRGGTDIGFFSLEDKSFGPVPGYDGHPQLIWPPPVWFTPRC